MKPVAFTHRLPTALNQLNDAVITQDQTTTENSSEHQKIQKFMAGGQSLGPLMNLRLARPEQLIQVTSVEELKHCEETDAVIHIGAATTHADIEDGKVSEPAGGMLQHVAGGIAYRAVRNRGTIGGSIAHADPAADWICSLTALDATINIRSTNVSTTKSNQNTRAMPITAFIIGAYTTALADDELIEHITIRKYSTDVRWGHYKLCRKVGELAETITSVVIDPQLAYCRVTAGSLGGAPVILQQTAIELATSASMPALDGIKNELNERVSSLDPATLHMAAVCAQRAIKQALGQ